MAKHRKRKVRPICKEHWRSMRKEALSVVPIWSRPLAVFKIDRMLREKGFVKSDDDCTYCKLTARAGDDR